MPAVARGKRQPSRLRKLVEPLHWWRIRRKLVKLKPRRTCTDCGFLAFGSEEATSADRIAIDQDGSLGLRGPVGNWCCARKLWDWELHYGAPNWDAVFGEANFDRRGCRHFMRWDPGRSPAEHLQLEREKVEFRRKLWLGFLPLIYSSLGGLVGWLLARYFQSGRLH